MHLFGNSSGPHLAHFHATCEGDQAELRWEVRDADEVRWRVLRSEREFADSADGIVGSGQEIVMDDTATNLSDRVVEGTTYYYAVFAQDECGAWHRLVKVKLKSREHGDWTYPRSDLSPYFSELELRMPRGR